jgi:hypothetical protein
MQKIDFKNLPDTSTPLNAENFNQLQTNVEDAITGSDWTNMTFVNGWSNYSDNYSLGQYKKIGNQVFLRGFITGGTSDLVTTLPEGFRPIRGVYDTFVKDNTTFGTAIVSSNGNVSLWGYDPNGWNSFNFSFFID